MGVAVDLEQAREELAQEGSQDTGDGAHEYCDYLGTTSHRDPDRGHAGGQRQCGA